MTAVERVQAIRSLNQAFSEVRQARVALGRLIGLVDIPDEASTSSLHACKAASGRWREVG